MIFCSQYFGNYVTYKLSRFDLYIHFLFFKCYFSCDFTLFPMSVSLYLATFSVSYRVQCYFPTLWSTGMSDTVSEFICTPLSVLACFAESNSPGSVL